MLRLRSAPLRERFAARPVSQSAAGFPFSSGSAGDPPAVTEATTLAPRALAFVRRRLPRESARAVEMLGHAIEYLADEWTIDPVSRGYRGKLDPRVEAIEVLKRLNREIYMSGEVVQPPLRRIRRWFLGEKTT